jgi:hypothetical protein
MSLAPRFSKAGGSEDGCMSKIPHRKSILRVVAPADSVGHASKSGQGEPESPLRNRSQHKRLFTNLLVRRQRRCRVRR